ncbi:carbohydrate binding domain-containing protein [Paenibacillus plantarum]|nr:carbohydrate binding domain-containing protein [Paenibacillus plantarum]
MLNGKRKHNFFVSLCLAMLLTFSSWNLTTNVANAVTPTPSVLANFQNNVVYGSLGTGNAEISNPASGYTMNPNFADDFSSYFNQQFNAQPLPLDIVTPGSVVAGNKSISQNSSSVAYPSQLYTGSLTISNVYGTMSIGDSTTVGTTVLYGGDSCTIGATSNLTIYGDVVCNGPITFTGNITGLTIHGNVIAAGDITFNSSVGSFTVDKTMSAQGGIAFQGSNITVGHIGGDLIGEGISFHGFSSLSVAGNVSSTLDFMPSSGNYTSFLIGKSLYVTGKSQFSTFNEVTIQGSYYGKGNIDMHDQISTNGLTVGESMLSNGSIDFHGIGAPVNVGQFLGALNQLNFNNNISDLVSLGGITAGQVNIYNNFAPANIVIDYNPPAVATTPILVGGTVTGSVYGVEGIPLKSATVLVNGIGLRAVTKAEGTYTIPNVPAGGYTLTVIKPGYVNGISDQIEVQEGGTSTVSLTLTVEQLLKNGGFEAVANSIPTDWKAFQNGWGSFMGVATEAARTGEYGMAIFTSQSNNPWVMQPIPVEEGATYKLTSWFKAIGVTGNAGYKVEFYSGIENTVENWVTGYESKAPVSQNDGQWHELNYEIQAPLGSKYMYVYLRLFGTGDLYYDDASVIKTINPRQLVGLETDQIYYYPDVTNGTVLAKLRPEDGSFNNKTVDIRIALEGSPSAVFEQTGLPAALEVNIPFDPTVMDLQQPYQITVVLKDEWQQSIDQLEKTIYRWPRPTALPENGPVHVDGQPFFPVIAYHANVEDYPYLKEVGINTVQGNSIRSVEDMEIILDTAQANGLKVLAQLYSGMKVKENFELTRAVVTAVKNHPALLGWMIMDEPVLNGIPQSELLEAYKLIRSIDPDHPTYMVEYDPGAFRMVGQATDILATDVYPYRTDFMQPISAVGESVRSAVANVDDVKPIWTVLQTFRLQNSVYSYLPTINQIRNMAYQSFLAGSKGLAYYSINDPGWKLKDSELWPGLVSFKEELKLIGNLNAEGTKLQESIGSNVQWGVWEHGQERYAVAINLTKQEQSTSIPINLQGHQIELMYGDQQKQWASWENSFHVTLAPEQTLVYRIQSFTTSVNTAVEQLQDAEELISNIDWKDKTGLLIGQLQQLLQALSGVTDTVDESLEKAIISLQNVEQLEEWTEQQTDSALEGKKEQLIHALDKVRSYIEPIVQTALQIDLHFDSEQTVQGDELAITVQVRNTLDAAIQNAMIRISLPDATGIAPIENNIGDMSSGASDTSSNSFDIPIELESGVYPVTAALQLQYKGKDLTLSTTKFLQIEPLLHAALISDSMNLHQTGTHSFSIELKNNSSQSITVDLSHAALEGIDVDLAPSVLLAGKEMKQITGTLTIPNTVTEGNYQLEVEAKVGNAVHISMPLSVSLDTNPVYNGGFEKQVSGAVKADGWYMATNTWDRIEAHSGLASARLDPDPANSWNVLSTAYDRSIPVIAGKKYVLSGWVKNSSLAGLVQLGIRQVNAAMGTVGSYSWGNTNNNSGWTRYEVSFTALPQTTAVQVYFKADQSVDGQSWIDDVQIQEDLNLLLNPGFEQLNAGKATNWSYYSTAGTSIATTSESARSGNYGIALKSVTTAMNPVLVKQGMVVVPGKTYEVSAWIRANNLQALGFKMYTEDYNGTTYLSSQAGNYVKPGPGVWTKVSFRFTAPQGANNAVVNFRLYGIGNVNGTDQIDLDDIAVIEVNN